MMMMTTTLLNDLAIAIVTDKSHADKLISILYKKKTVYKREDEDRIINVRACMHSICLSRMCVCESKCRWWWNKKREPQEIFSEKESNHIFYCLIGKIVTLLLLIRILREKYCVSPTVLNVTLLFFFSICLLGFFLYHTTTIIV